MMQIHIYLCIDDKSIILGDTRLFKVRRLLYFSNNLRYQIFLQKITILY